jgi:hypothetical protein
VALTHYTESAEALASILAHGFVWVHNRRHLIEAFIPNHQFFEREPQEFGMISFTELEPHEVDRTRSNFGPFGVKVSADWARRHRADRVIYISDEGPAFEAWRTVFQIAYDDLSARISFPDDRGWTMAYENKNAAAAVAGAPLWAHLLQLYEYMEPAVHAHEREWRVVRDEPVYNDPVPGNEAVRNAIPPTGWGKVLDVLPAKAADVTLICPESLRAQLLEVLPADFESVPIVTYNATSQP